MLNKRSSRPKQGRGNAPPDAKDCDRSKEALLGCQARERQRQVAPIRHNQEAQVTACGTRTQGASLRYDISYSANKTNEIKSRVCSNVARACNEKHRLKGADCVTHGSHGVPLPCNASACGFMGLKPRLTCKKYALRCHGCDMHDQRHAQQRQQPHHGGDHRPAVREQLGRQRHQAACARHSNALLDKQRTSAPGYKGVVARAYMMTHASLARRNST